MPLINSTTQLNDRMNFKAIEYEYDESWQMIEVLGETVYSAWCMVKTRKLSEFQTQMNTILQDSIQFIILSQQGYEINTNLKVEWKGKVYDIADINHDYQNKKYDVLICKVNNKYND